VVKPGHVGKSARALRRLMVVFAVMAVALPAVAVSASAGSQQPITITTAKPFGPVAGTFSVSGAFADGGQMEHLSRTASGFGAPTFLGSHLAILAQVDTRDQVDGVVRCAFRLSVAGAVRPSEGARRADRRG